MVSTMVESPMSGLASAFVISRKIQTFDGILNGSCEPGVSRAANANAKIYAIAAHRSDHIVQASISRTGSIIALPMAMAKFRKN